MYLCEDIILKEVEHFLKQKYGTIQIKWCIVIFLFSKNNTFIITSDKCNRETATF